MDNTEVSESGAGITDQGAGIGELEALFVRGTRKSGSRCLLHSGWPNVRFLSFHQMLLLDY